ncbi:MAG: hypothetical protein WAX14_02510 [Rhodococcus sp. (in: high G+C Gram-positive bacteria)]|uniref:restriction endonuclease subunit S n=1 Tax=Rhodococcus sp. TaxID=1831 RepID=UPI003BB69738
MTLTLLDVTSKIGSGATPRGGKSVYQDTGVSFLRSQNILDFSVSDEGMAFIDDDAAHALRSVAVRAGDVLVNITGDSVARVAIWERADDARVSQHVAIVRPDPDVAVGRYLMYWLIASAQKSALLTLSAAGGSRPALTKGMLEQFPFGSHSLPEQGAIAEVLGVLDDKIAANRRVLTTTETLLEGLALRFRANGTPTTLGALLRLNYGKSLPVAKRTHGKVAVVGSGGVAGTHDKALVDGPCVVLGRKGSVGETYWIDGPAYPIDTTYWVEPTKAPLLYLYYLLKSIDFASMSTDSAVPGLNRDRAYAVEVPAADPTDMNEFESEASSLAELRKAVRTENERLAATRDELLPLLMSGKITVKDAENRIEEAE